jgi:ISXO2-like transposase domain
VWALLKHGFHGVYHRFSVKHMQRYVDEFTYRLNEGNCKVHTMDGIDALVAKADGVHHLQGADGGRMSDERDAFERLVDRVLAYRPKSKRKKKRKGTRAKKKPRT